ncbi:cyclase (adenylyl or guanylyl) [Beggiatoa sp. PS]|nr:cyclase (adenylyl or guanylyl) [Beggiatoa sp. PS]
MYTIPMNIAQYIYSLKMADTVLAYLSIDENDNLINYGGQLHYYGLSNLTLGKSATEQLLFLDGMLPISDNLVLPFLSLDDDCCAHVHIVPHNNGVYVLLFDATCEHKKQQKIQQQLNNLQLSMYRKDQCIHSLKEENRQLRQHG